MNQLCTRNQVLKQLTQLKYIQEYLDAGWDIQIVQVDGVEVTIQHNECRKIYANTIAFGDNMCQ